MKKNHLEIEYKTLLSPVEFKRLLAEFADVKPVVQTNYYIDTPDFSLRQCRYSLRIRTLENHAELTLKIPQEIGNKEYNQLLSLDEADQLMDKLILPEGEILGLLKETGIAIEQLTIWGQLTTKRREKQTSIGLMALDKNTYENQTDYELEVEVTEAKQGKLDFEAYLRKHRITFKYARSKVARTAAILSHIP